jgi:hypothetical protein
MRGGTAAFCLVCFAAIAACVSDDPSGSNATRVPPGSDSGPLTDAGTVGDASCPLTLLNQNTGFEIRDNVWVLGPNTKFVSEPHTGIQGLEIGQASERNFGNVYQTIPAGRALVRFWYRKHQSKSEFFSLKFEFIGGMQAVFGRPMPSQWTCAIARIEAPPDSGDRRLFISGFEPDKDAGSAVLVDDVEAFELPPGDNVPEACLCPP